MLNETLKGTVVQKKPTTLKLLGDRKDKEEVQAKWKFAFDMRAVTTHEVNRIEIWIEICSPLDCNMGMVISSCGRKEQKQSLR